MPVCFDRKSLWVFLLPLSLQIITPTVSFLVPISTQIQTVRPSFSTFTTSHHGQYYSTNANVRNDKQKVKSSLSMVSYDELMERLPSKAVIDAVEKSPSGSVVASGKFHFNSIHYICRYFTI